MQIQLTAALLVLPSNALQAPGSSRIPVPSPSPPSAAVRSSAHPSGSLTARPSLGRPTRSPQLSSSIPRGPLSARESPAEAAARRAALQRNAGAAGAGAGSSLRRSIAAPSSSAAMRRSVSGASEVSSSGTLNSARGVRSSQAGSGRRWN